MINRVPPQKILHLRYDKLGTGNDIYLPEDFSRFCKKFAPFFTEEGRSVGIGKTVFWNMQGVGRCGWKGACEEFGQETW
jgi:hypothetical protein